MNTCSVVANLAQIIADLCLKPQYHHSPPFPLMYWSFSLEMEENFSFCFSDPILKILLVSLSLAWPQLILFPYSILFTRTIIQSIKFKDEELHCKKLFQLQQPKVSNFYHRQSTSVKTSTLANKAEAVIHWRISIMWQRRRKRSKFQAFAIFALSISQQGEKFCIIANPI